MYIEFEDSDGSDLSDYEPQEKPKTYKNKNLPQSSVSKKYFEKKFLTLTKGYDDWPELGLALNVPRSKLKSILSLYPSDVLKAKSLLIEKWLETDDNASWLKLSVALNELKEHDISKYINETYLNSSKFETISNA